MNSTSRRCLSVLAILLALPAQAQTPAPAKPKGAAPKAESPTPSARIATGLEAMRAKVLAGDADRAAYEELVGAIKADYAALEQSTPDANTVRTRLVAGIDDMYSRAKESKIAPEEFTALKADLLDAHLADTLAALAAKPDGKGLEALATSVGQLADASAELDPGTAEWRAHAQTLLDGLKKEAKLEPAALEPLREELAHARAMRWEAVLEKRATAKAATPTDFMRARNHVSDLLELQSQKDPGARELQQKLLATIDDLEQRAAGAALTKADFESLRKEIAQRGRTALAEKAKPKG